MMSFKDSIYNLKIPFVINNDTTEEEKCLYQILDLPNAKIQELLRINYEIELLEEENIGHALRVAYLVKRICDELNFSDKKKKNIYLAALFHDIGKIKISPNIISKKGKLTDEEYNIIKKHCVQAALVLNGQVDPEIIEMIKNHHERLNGSGYPLGKHLIDIGSQIIGLVDSYDAMTSYRVYNIPKSKDEALNELYLCTFEKEQGGKGKLFNSKLVDILTKVVDE